MNYFFDHQFRGEKVFGVRPPFGLESDDGDVAIETIGDLPMSFPYVFKETDKFVAITPYHTSPDGSVSMYPIYLDYGFTGNFMIGENKKSEIGGLNLLKKQTDISLTTVPETGSSTLDGVPLKLRKDNALFSCSYVSWDATTLYTVDLLLGGQETNVPHTELYQADTVSTFDMYLSPTLIWDRRKAHAVVFVVTEITGLSDIIISGGDNITNVNNRINLLGGGL